MQGRENGLPPIRLPERDFSIQRGDFAGDGADFEVRFFERILEADPDHVDALMFLGNSYTARGEHARGLEMDLRLSKLLPRNPLVRYNLACSYSLLTRLDDAFDALARAIEFGYADLEHMLQDDDLANMREDARFAGMVEAVEAVRAASRPG